MRILIVEDELPNASVREYSEELEDGNKIYEISFHADGRKFDILYAHDGQVRELEETITAHDIPTAIITDLNKRFDAYEIDEAQKINKGSEMLYEVELTATSDDGKRKYELRFSKTGNLLKQEEEAEDEDDEKP